MSSRSSSAVARLSCAAAGRSTAAAIARTANAMRSLMDSVPSPTRAAKIVLLLIGVAGCRGNTSEPPVTPDTVAFLDSLQRNCRVPYQVVLHLNDGEIDGKRVLSATVGGALGLVTSRLGASANTDTGAKSRTCHCRFLYSDMLIAIAEVVAKLQEVLKGNPPPWLRKAMNGALAVTAESV